MDISQAPMTIARENASPASAAQDKPGISSDFDTFLKMMTAQIQNQDPLNPMKSEEFAVQLATFSNVEQSVKTNELLQAMVSGNGSDEFTAMSNWIGREVRAPMDVRYTGQPITLDPQAPIAGSRHELVVRDAQGIEIDRRQIDAIGSPTQWAGTRTRGGAAPLGVYSFSVESFEGQDLVATQETSAYARVTEVRAGADGPSLVFGGGIEIPAMSVSAVREAG